MNLNQVVKFKEPMSKDEAAERFVIVEVRGDRVLVELVCEMTIRPTFVYMAEEMVEA